MGGNTSASIVLAPSMRPSVHPIIKVTSLLFTPLIPGIGKAKRSKTEFLPSKHSQVGVGCGHRNRSCQCHARSALGSAGCWAQWGWGSLLAGGDDRRRRRTRVKVPCTPGSPGTPEAARGSSPCPAESLQEHFIPTGQGAGGPPQTPWLIQPQLPLCHFHMAPSAVDRNCCKALVGHG